MASEKLYDHVYRWNVEQVYVKLVFGFEPMPFCLQYYLSLIAVSILLAANLL